MMVAKGQVRASGETTAEEASKEESKKFSEPLETEVLPEERKRGLRTPGFARMRTDWRGDDRVIVTRVMAVVNQKILTEFWDAYEVLHQIYELVRTPVLDENDEPVRDKFGFVVWKQSPNGSYEEDFSTLTRKQKEHLLFLLTTREFEWSQRAADLWGESMLAKSQWEERFAIAFDAPMSGTVDDRRAAGNIDAREERYFAIVLATQSRKADALVRSLTTMAQRLKDSMAF